MKLSEGFTRTIPSIFIFVFYALSFTALTMALKRIDVSVAYAIWSGVGTALIVIIGAVHFSVDRKRARNSNDSDRSKRKAA